jgi:hypothetical protein
MNEGISGRMREPAFDDDKQLDIGKRSHPVVVIYRGHPDV